MTGRLNNALRRLRSVACHDPASADEELLASFAAGLAGAPAPVVSSTVTASKRPLVEGQGDARRRAFAQITVLDTGGYLIDVHICKEVKAGSAWKPAGRDLDMERIILQLLAGRPVGGTAAQQPRRPKGATGGQ